MKNIAEKTDWNSWDSYVDEYHFHIQNIYLGLTTWDLDQWKLGPFSYIQGKLEGESAP